MTTPQQKIRDPKYRDGLLNRFKIILLGTSSTTSVDIHKARARKSCHTSKDIRYEKNGQGDVVLYSVHV